MRIYILDDEEIFLNQLSGSIYEILPALDNDVLKFQKPADLLEMHQKEKPQAIFLDIEMPEMDGMAVAREIRKTDRETPIIFLTSHTELAMDGYEVNAFRFLSKPVNKEKLAKTISDIRARNKETNVILRQSGEDIVIKTKDILFIESDNNDIRVITTEGTYITRKKLQDFVEEVNRIEDTIRKVHRSTAVNLAHVARIKDKEVILDTNQTIPISRREFNTFKEELYEYVKKAVR